MAKQAPVRGETAWTSSSRVREGRGAVGGTPKMTESVDGGQGRRAKQYSFQIHGCYTVNWNSYPKRTQVPLADC